MTTLTNPLAWFSSPKKSAEEREEIERQKASERLAAKLLAEQRKEARYLAKAIPKWLAMMGHAYWYKKSERDEQMGSKFKPVIFDRIEIAEDAVYLRIKTTRLPRGVLIADLRNEDTLETLSKAAFGRVRYHDMASGSWYSVETAYGRGSIPKFVGFAEMMKLLPENAPSLTFPIGMGENQKPFFCDLDKVYTLLIGGAKGTGKSNLANAMLCCLLSRNSPKRLRIFLTDLKGGIEFYDYGGVAHLGGDVFVIPGATDETAAPRKKNSPPPLPRLAPVGYKLKGGEELAQPLGQKVISDPADVLPMLRYCEAELDRRARLLAPTGAKNIITYNKKFPDKAMSYWLVIIDELATLMEHPEYKKMAQLSLSEIARKGRACGLYIVLATQNPESHIVPGQVAANMDARLAFRTGSGTASGILLGDGKYDAVHLPPIPGRLIWKWGAEVEQLQSPFLSENAMRGLIGEIKSGKVVDAREAEVQQKADFLFKFAMENFKGECNTSIYKFLKADGFTKAQTHSILSQCEVTLQPNGVLGPEIIIDSVAYYLMPGDNVRKISRWLVPVGEVNERKHPKENYDFEMFFASRVPHPENLTPSILTEPTKKFSPSDQNLSPPELVEGHEKAAKSYQLG